MNKLDRITIEKILSSNKSYSELRKDFIEQCEGVSKTLYTDTKGKKTIGYCATITLSGPRQLGCPV